MTETPAPTILVSAAEAARECRASRATWYAWLSAGRIPAPVRIGRRTLWRRDELVQWIAAGCPGRDRWEALKAQGVRL